MIVTTKHLPEILQNKSLQLSQIQKITGIKTGLGLLCPIITREI